jgi:hypothetical protein
MRRFVQSGAMFAGIALVCMAAALGSAHGAVYASVGAVWLIVAIAVRRKSSREG